MTEATDPAAIADDDIGYTAALAELAEILHELDGDEVDVDVLGGRVRRAAELLRICRGRIASARFEVEQVVAELDPAALPTASDPGLDPAIDSSPEPSSTDGDATDGG